MSAPKKLPAKPALAIKPAPFKLAQPLKVGGGATAYPVAKSFGKAPSLGNICPGMK